MLLWYSMELVLYVYILQWLQSYSQGVRVMDSTSVPHPQGEGLLVRKDFGHLVQGATGFEPVNLGLIVGVHQFKLV